MTEMVQIRSVKQFFNDFLVEPYKANGLDWIRNHTDDIRANMLEAFRKEVFGQIVFKLGAEKVCNKTLEELSKEPKVENILEQSFRKWRRICTLCSEHGLGSFLGLDDLSEALKETPSDTVILPDSEEDVTDKLDEPVVYLDDVSTK